MKQLLPCYKKIAYAIASGGYVGMVPYCKGTIMSLITAVLLYYLPPVSLFLQLIFIFLLLLLGIYVSTYFVLLGNDPDPGWIVIDELVGMWIALLGVPKQFWWYFTAFLIFRFFDISKCCGVSYFERLQGGLGVMLDDCAAGLITLVCIVCIQLAINAL